MMRSHKSILKKDLKLIAIVINFYIPSFLNLQNQEEIIIDIDIKFIKNMSLSSPSFFPLLSHVFFLFQAHHLDRNQLPCQPFPLFAKQLGFFVYMGEEIKHLRSSRICVETSMFALVPQKNKL